MKKIIDFFRKGPAAYALAACAAILFYFILANLGQIKSATDAVLKLLSPVFTGIVIAYLFNPVSTFFETKVCKKMKTDSAKHSVAVTLTAVCLVIVVALLLVALIPSVAKSVSTLVSNWDGYIVKLNELVAKAEQFVNEHNINIDMKQVNDFIGNLSDKIFNLLKDNSKVIFSTLGNVGTGVSNFVVGVLFGFCFMFTKSSLLRFLNIVRRAILTPERMARNNELFGHCNEVFIKYMGSTLTDSLIIGIATLIFTLIMRMPYAPLIAVIAAVMNIIPTFGPMIGTALGMFFLVLDNPWNALWLMVFQCILQSIDGMIIKPRLFKGSLGLPAAWTLVLIVLGGKIAGMAGIILCIPFGAIFVILWNETIVPILKEKAKKLEKKNNKKSS